MRKKGMILVAAGIGCLLLALFCSGIGTVLFVTLGIIFVMRGLKRGGR